MVENKKVRARTGNVTEPEIVKMDFEILQLNSKINEPEEEIKPEVKKILVMKMEKEPEIQLKNMKFVNTTWLKHVSKVTGSTETGSNIICSADRCHYMHKQFPCKSFHFSKNCFRGDKCLFSHEPPNGITSKILDRIRVDYWIPDDTKEIRALETANVPVLPKPPQGRNRK